VSGRASSARPPTEIEQGFDEVVNRWFRLVEDLDDVLNLYLSTVHAPPRFPETRFLIFVQALEGYHRITADVTKGEFLETVEATRNTLAHSLVPRHKKAARDVDLWRVTTQLQALFETIIFLDLGFNDDVIADRLKWRGDRYSRIRVYADT
jgi:Apea-like HEPN